MLEAFTLGQQNPCSTQSPPADVIVAMENTAGVLGMRSALPRKEQSLAVMDFISVHLYIYTFCTFVSVHLWRAFPFYNGLKNTLNNKTADRGPWEWHLYALKISVR